MKEMKWPKTSWNAIFRNHHSNLTACNEMIFIYSCTSLHPRRKANMFDKDTVSLRRKVGFSITKFKNSGHLQQVALMITGFPCTPFSRLHNNSSLLDDGEAKQFYETVARIKACQPCATCQQIKHNWFVYGGWVSIRGIDLGKCAWHQESAVGGG